MAIITLLLILISSCPAIELADIVTEINAVLKRYKVDAKVVMDNEGAYVLNLNVRTFVVYRDDLVGNWQKPKEEIGPDKNGLTVFLEERQGPYEGPSLKIITTNDMYLWQESWVKLERADASRWLYGRVQFPRYGFGKAFQDEILGIINKYK